MAEKLTKSKKIKIYSISAASVMLIGGGVATAAILLTDKKQKLEDSIDYFVGNKMFRTREDAEAFIQAHSQPSMLPVYDGRVYPTVADAWLDAAMHVETITDFYYASKIPQGANGSFVDFHGIHSARESDASGVAAGYERVYAIAKVDPVTGEPILDALGNPTFYLYASKAEAEEAWLKLNPIKTLGVGDLSGNTYTAEQIRARNIYLSDMAFRILHPKPPRSASQDQIDEYNQLVSENYMSLIAPAGAIEGMNYPQIGDGSNRRYTADEVAARDANPAPYGAVEGDSSKNSPRIGDGSGRQYTRAQIEARDIAQAMIDGSYMHTENGQSFYLSLIPSSAVAGENRPPVGAGDNRHYTQQEVEDRDDKGKIIPDDALPGINFPAIGAGNGITYTQAQIDARDEMFPAPAGAVVGFNPSRTGAGDGLEYTQQQLDARDANAAPNGAVVGINTRAHGDGTGNTYTQEQVDAMHATAAPAGAVEGENREQSYTTDVYVYSATPQHPNETSNTSLVGMPLPNAVWHRGGLGDGGSYTQSQIDKRDLQHQQSSNTPAEAEAGYNISQVGDGSNRYYTSEHISAHNAAAAPAGAEVGYNRGPVGTANNVTHSRMEVQTQFYEYETNRTVVNLRTGSVRGAWNEFTDKTFGSVNWEWFTSSGAYSPMPQASSPFIVKTWNPNDFTSKPFTVNVDGVDINYSIIDIFTALYIASGGEVDPSLTLISMPGVTNNFGNKVFANGYAGAFNAMLAVQLGRNQDALFTDYADMINTYNSNVQDSNIMKLAKNPSALATAWDSVFRSDMLVDYSSSKIPFFGTPDMYFTSSTTNPTGRTTKIASNYLGAQYQADPRQTLGNIYLPAIQTNAQGGITATSAGALSGSLPTNKFLGNVFAALGWKFVFSGPSTGFPTMFAGQNGAVYSPSRDFTASQAQAFGAYAGNTSPLNYGGIAMKAQYNGIRNMSNSFTSNLDSANQPLPNATWIPGGLGDNKVYTQAQIDKRDGFIFKVADSNQRVEILQMLSPAGDAWLTDAASLNSSQRKAWFNTSITINSTNNLFTNQQGKTFEPLTDLDRMILGPITTSGFVVGFNVAQSFISESDITASNLPDDVKNRIVNNAPNAVTQAELLHLFETQFKFGQVDNDADESWNPTPTPRDNDDADAANPDPDEVYFESIFKPGGNGDNHFYGEMEIKLRDESPAPAGAVVGYNAPILGLGNGVTYTQAEIDRREGVTLAGDELPRRPGSTDYNPNWAPIGAVVGLNAQGVGAADGVTYTQAEIDKRNGYVEVPTTQGTPGAVQNANGIWVLHAHIAPNGAVLGINYKGSAREGGFGDGSDNWYTQSQIDKRNGYVEVADPNGQYTNSEGIKVRHDNVAPLGAVAEGTLIYFDRYTGKWIEGADGILGSDDDVAGPDRMISTKPRLLPDGSVDPIFLADDDTDGIMNVDEDNLKLDQQISEVSGIDFSKVNFNNSGEKDYSFQGDRYLPITVTNNSRNFVINNAASYYTDTTGGRQFVFHPNANAQKVEADAMGRNGGTGDGMEYTPFEIANKNSHVSPTPYEAIADGDTIFYNMATGRWLASPIQQVEVNGMIFFVLGKVGTFYSGDATTRIQKRYDLVGMRYIRDFGADGLPNTSDDVIEVLTAKENDPNGVGSPEVEDPVNNPIDPARFVRDERQNISIYRIGSGNASGSSTTDTGVANNPLDAQIVLSNLTPENGYRGIISGNSDKTIMRQSGAVQPGGDGSGITYTDAEIQVRDGIMNNNLVSRDAIAKDDVIYFDPKSQTWFEGKDGVVGYNGITKQNDDEWGIDGVDGTEDDVVSGVDASNNSFTRTPGTDYVQFGGSNNLVNAPESGDGSGHSYTKAEIDARNGFVEVIDPSGTFLNSRGIKVRHDPIAPDGAIAAGTELVYDHVTGRFLVGADGILGTSDDDEVVYPVDPTQTFPDHRPDGTPHPYAGQTWNGQPLLNSRGYTLLTHAWGADMGSPLNSLADHELDIDGADRFENISVTANTMPIGAGDGRIYTRAQIQARDRVGLPESTPSLSQIRQHMLDLRILQPVTMGIGTPGSLEAKYDILGQAIAHLHDDANNDGTIDPSEIREIPVLSPLAERNEDELFALFNDEIRGLDEFVAHERGLAIEGLNSPLAYTTPDDFERAFAQRSTGATPDRTQSVAELQVHGDIYKALFNADGTLRGVVDNTKETQPTTDDLNVYLDDTRNQIAFEGSTDLLGQRTGNPHYTIQPGTAPDPVSGDGLFMRDSNGHVSMKNGVPQMSTQEYTKLGWIYDESLVSYVPQTSGTADTQELVYFIGDGQGERVSEDGTTFDIAQAQADAIVEYENLMLNHADGSGLTDSEKQQVASHFPEWFFKLEPDATTGELVATGALVDQTPDLAGLGANEATGVDVELDLDEDGTIDLTKHFDTIEEAYEDLIAMVDIEKLPHINDTDKIWVLDPVTGKEVEQANPNGGWAIQYKVDENGDQILGADGKPIPTGYMIDHNGEVKMPGLDYISDPHAKFTSWQELEAYEAAKAQAAIAAVNNGATEEEVLDILESPSTVDGDAQDASIIYEDNE